MVKKKKDHLDRAIEICDDILKECEAVKKNLDDILLLMKEENPSMR